MSARVLDPYAGAIDLGRHLRDGELLLSSSAWEVLHTNFYSYTHTDAPFVDHHWLASVVFFVIWKWVGFAGLNVFYILLGAATFLIFFRMAERAAGFPLSFGLALVLMPILRARQSIRPEIFTFLLCGVFFWLLWSEAHSGAAPGWKRPLLFASLQILWVNLHAGFVFGPFFAAVFLVSEFLERREWDREKRLRVQRFSIILLVTAAACLVNPSGIRGALYPLTLATVSFPIGENLSMLTLTRIGAQIEWISLGAAAGLLAASFAFQAWKRRFVWPLFLLSGTVFIMTVLMYRNHPVFGFLSLAIIAMNAGLSGITAEARHKRIVLTVVSLAILAGLYVNASRMIEEESLIGLGQIPGRDAVAEFIRTNNLQEPLFNNFNIGSYLIYHLFPQLRVYIDSRPEAYPSEFLDNGYLLPMSNEEDWERLFTAYQFNTIVFCWTTKSEERFIVRRMLDPTWSVVFLNNSAVILVRRIVLNQNIISRFEIPKDRLPLLRVPVN